jgi:PAS domain S-box-containing protein
MVSGVSDPPTAAPVVEHRVLRLSAPLAAGVLCAALGMAVMVAWHTGLTALIQVRASYRPMPYGSAVAFVLLGGGLIAMSRAELGALRWSAVALGALMAVAVAGPLLGQDFSFERLLRLSDLGYGRVYFGRMPPNEILNFVLAALALRALADDRRLNRFVAPLASVVAGIGLTSLVGYATLVNAAYAWPGLPAMAVHGAAAFALVGFVLLHAAWEQARAERLEMPTWMPVPLAIIPSTMSVVVWQALLEQGRTPLAYSTLAAGLTFAAGTAIAVYFAQAARRELRRAERAGRELRSEIHEREQVQAALRQSEQRVRATFDNAGVGIIEVDTADDRFVAVNDRVCEILGYQREELLGKTVYEMTAPEDLERTTDLIRQLRHGTLERLDYEKRYLKKDGSRAWVHVTVSAVRDAKGRWVRSIATVADIAERKRAEETERLLAENLRDADRRKDEFLATLAHELRNPLAAVRFALAMCERGDADTARRGHEVIARQVNQLVRLIDDLLDVSRVTRDKIQLRLDRVRLSGVMRAAVESTEPQFTAAGHRLTLKADLDATLHADPARMTQVFSNLLSNAAKFTPPGGDISFVAAVEGDHVVARVRDNGMGIAPDALPYVFELFHQADSTLERSAGGLGIGLTLARRLCEMHNGTLEAFSEGPGRGAEFVVRLPLAEPGPEHVRETTARADTAPARPLRVLIVDDNVDAAEMLDMLVRTSGHSTRTVHEGPYALDAFEPFQPDVVLLDIGLPGIDGYEVARELRRRSATVYLAAVTGWGQEEDRRRSRDAGFDCHLTKPADPDVVVRLLDAVSHRAGCAGCEKCLRGPMTRLSDGSPWVDPSPP